MRGHGHSAGGKKTPEYTAWQNLKARCDSSYGQAKDYALRGIGVAQQWRNSFAAFLADMGPRPTPRHTVERINNDRGYEPGNCRWATRAEQLRNTRRNVTVIVNGHAMCLTDAARAAGLSKGTVRGRKNRGNVDLTRLVTPKRTIEWGGRTRLLKDVARENGLALSTVWSRLKQGWTPEQAVSVPRGAYVTGKEWRDAH